MRLFLAAVLLASVSVASADSGEGDSNIIGGTNTSVGDYPTVVAVTIGGALCTGTFINPEWVLTAAHCISPAILGASQAQITAATQVHFNTVNLNQSSGMVVGASQTIPRLPNWNTNNIGANDIGLIKLESPVTSITPTPVNLDRTKSPIGISVTMVGYGATRSGTPPGGSFGIQFELLNRTSTACAQFGESDANLLCWTQNDGRGKCQGDSGGPSFATIDGVVKVVGVTSFGDEGCEQLGADTRPDAERAFLLQHVPQLEGCMTAEDCGEGNICVNGKCISEPFSEGGLGTECTVATECDSGQCASGPDGMRCTELCSPGVPGTCPDGFECLGASGDNGACWPEGFSDDDDGGCCDASGNGAPTGLLGFALVGLLWRRRRR